MTGQKNRLEKTTQTIVLREFPPTVISLAKLLADGLHGSEEFVAQMMLNDTKNVGLVGAAFSWLVFLAQSVDVDRRAKSPQIRRYAKVALGDLARAIIKASAEERSLMEFRAEQRKMVSTMRLLEIGAIEF
jgi:hypothetical protein